MATRTADKALRVRPFSNGFEYQVWNGANCDHCFASSVCSIEEALSIAHFGDGLVEAEIAERMGYSHERSRELAWRCGEFEEMT